MSYYKENQESLNIPTDSFSQSQDEINPKHFIPIEEASELKKPRKQQNTTTITHTLPINQQQIMTGSGEEKGIINDENEGDCKISNIEGLQISYGKVALSVLLIIVSALTFGLALLWFKKLQKKFFYNSCDLNQASHILVYDHNNDIWIEKIELLKTDDQKFFACRFKSQYVKYMYDLQENKFAITRTSQQDMTHAQLLNSPDVNSSQVPFLQEKFGNCKCETPEPKLIPYLFKELSQPYFFLQYFSGTIWTIQGQMIFAVALIGFSVMFTLVNFYVYIKKAHKKLQQSLDNYEIVQILRDGEFKDLSSDQLVPGDKLILKDGLKLPCDVAMIKGELFTNEASLTGESLPIAKFPLENKNKKLDFDEDKKHILLEGTTIISTKSQTDCIGLALRTGFITQKGQIFRSVLFPSAVEYDFYISLLKFMGLCFLIVALSYPAYGKLLSDIGNDAAYVVLIFFGSLVDVTPPALPVLISCALGGGLSRLKKQEVQCQKPEKILPAQSVETMCFDKTGTLTQDKIILKNVYNSKLKQAGQNDMEINYLMSSCHMLQKIKGEVLGDELELAMVNQVQAQVQGNGISVYLGQEIQILKLFEFDSLYARMGVVVKILNDYYVFCKGAPEIVSSLCNDVPKEYQHQLEQLSFQGLRVLAMGCKKLTIADINDLQNKNREYFETNMSFKGLLAFENPLKTDTADVIQELRESEFGVRIISGDNHLTTISCGITANIINPSQPVVLLQTNQDHQLVAQKIDCKEQIVHEQPLKYSSLKEYKQFAITGSCLRAYMEEYIQLSETQREGLKQIIQKRTLIFARQKPEQKAQIISLLQQSGKKIGMVGDGANDCAAIKQADLGISFSNCDASYSSPFTYYKTSINVAPIVIKDAKGCMANIVDIFRTYMIGNIIRYIVFWLMAYECTTPNNFSGLFMSFATVLPMETFLGYSRPSSKKLKNVYASNTFFGWENILSVFGQLIIMFFALLFGFYYLRAQDFHHKITCDDIDQDFNKKHGENNRFNVIGDMFTVMIQMTNVLLIFSYMAIIHGEPLKEKLVKSKCLFIFLSVFGFYDLLLVLVPQAQIPWMHYTEFEFSFRIVIFTALIGFGALQFAWEHYIVKKKFGILKRLELWNDKVQRKISSNSHISFQIKD